MDSGPYMVAIAPTIFLLGWQSKGISASTVCSILIFQDLGGKGFHHLDVVPSSQKPPPPTQYDRKKMAITKEEFLCDVRAFFVSSKKLIDDSISHSQFKEWKKDISDQIYLSVTTEVERQFVADYYANSHSKWRHIHPANSGLYTYAQKRSTDDQQEDGIDARDFFEHVLPRVIKK